MTELSQWRIPYRAWGHVRRSGERQRPFLPQSSLPGDGVERSSVFIEGDAPLVNEEILDDLS